MLSAKHASTGITGPAWHGFSVLNARATQRRQFGVQRRPLQLANGAVGGSGAAGNPKYPPVPDPFDPVPPPYQTLAPLPALASEPLGAPANADTLGAKATTIRNFAFASFWVQLPLSIVSGCILIFAVLYSRQPADVSRYFTFAGVALAFISTFFAHGFLTLAKKALDKGENVSRSRLVRNLVRNNSLNLVAIGLLIIGLQASVGTLVSKTMLQATNAPLAVPAPGATLISLDVFSLQASTNTLLSHFLSVVFANFMTGALSG